MVVDGSKDGGELKRQGWDREDLVVETADPPDGGGVRSVKSAERTIVLM